MKKVFMLLALTLLCVAPATAKPRNVMGSEQYKTRDVYTVEPFKALSVHGQTEVEFTQAPEGTYTVSFMGPYNLAEMVRIKSKEGTLHIDYAEPIVVLGDQQLRVQVAAPDLTRIEVKEAGEVHIHAPLYVQESELVLAADGKGEIELDDVRVQSLRVEVKGDAEADVLTLQCQTLHIHAADTSSADVQQADCDSVFISARNRAEVEVTGLNATSLTAENWNAAETELKGRVDGASLTARNRSEINAEGLQAANADVLAERSAKVGVRVSGILNAEAQGRGVVAYKGWPLEVNRTGKGTVQPQR